MLNSNLPSVLERTFIVFATFADDNGHAEVAMSGTYIVGQRDEPISCGRRKVLKDITLTSRETVTGRRASEGIAGLVSCRRGMTDEW